MMGLSDSETVQGVLWMVRTAKTIRESVYFLLTSAFSQLF